MSTAAAFQPAAIDTAALESLPAEWAAETWAHLGMRDGRHARCECSLCEAIDATASERLRLASGALFGDADALAETRDALTPYVSELEALSCLLRETADPDVQRWLAAAREYADLEG